MKKYWQALYPWIKPQLAMLLVTLGLSLPLGLTKAYQTYLVKDLFDHGFSVNTAAETAYRLAIIIIALQVINYPIRFFHFYWIKVISEKIANGIRLHIFNHLMKLPLPFHHRQKQGELLSTIQSDVAIIAESVRFLPALIREPISAFCLLGVAVYHDWRLTLVLLAAVPIFVLIFDFTGKKIRVRVGRVQKAIAHFTHVLSEGLAGQKIIKANNLQKFSATRLEKTQNEYIKTYERCASMEEQSSPLIELVAAIALGGIIIYAHHRITEGQLTTGAFISFMAAMAFFMEPVRKYTDASIKLQRGLGAFDRVQKILQEKVEPSQQREFFPATFSALQFQSLSFAYDKDLVLKDFSLHIERGQKVALVGLSGSGKSTLINLILRFYHPSKGKILVDGENIQDLELFDYRKHFALVSQDLFLFHDTIRENLTTGQNFSDEEIWQALETAYAKDFVALLPEKLETVVGDRGLRLSGGQAQRISIARAILQNAPILLFDEATSALDNESEKMVQKAIEKISHSKTVLTIAHRLSTIQNYDRIIVLKDGEKIEEGSHLQLMNQPGEYQKLYQLGLA